ncbi:MAG: hypothetical protein WCB19_00995 [Thermoplasmata archaeon]
MDGKPRPRIRTLWPLVGIVAIAGVLLASGAWYLYAQSFNTCAGCPPWAGVLVFGGPTNSSSAGQWTYGFLVEKTPPGLLLTNLSFAVFLATGFPAELAHVCVAGPNGVPLGTWFENWSATGDSAACSASATNPPGEAVLAAGDTADLYIDQNAAGDTLTIFMAHGQGAASFAF